jgi:uncharacterized membrane protein YhaH (DUF805 family)
MSLIPAALSKYATFSGRARRSEYWYFILFYLVVYVAFLVAGAVTKSSSPMLSLVLQLLGAVFSLAMFVPSIAVSVRRLHDTDRSGWWFFIVLVPLVGSIVLLVFFLLDSQPGDNSFGPNPKGISDPKAASGGTSMAVIAAVAIVLVIFVGGIVAGVAVPAYQDYQARVAISRALSELARFRPQVAALARQSGYAGSLAQAGISLSGTEFIDSLYYDPKTLTLVGNLAGSFQGRSIGIQVQQAGGDSPTWVCGTKNLELKYLPASCRRQIAYLDEREAQNFQRAAPRQSAAESPPPAASPAAVPAASPPRAAAAPSSPAPVAPVAASAVRPDPSVRARAGEDFSVRRQADLQREQDARRRMKAAQSACVYKPVMTDEDIAKCR